MNVIRVVDVPMGTCADEAQRLLNTPCAESHYLLVQVLQLPDGVTRAIYRLLAKAYGAHQGMAPHRGNRDGKEAVALDVIRSNPHDSISQILAKFEAEGISRGRNWVSEKRRELRQGSHPTPIGK